MGGRVGWILERPAETGSGEKSPDPTSRMVRAAHVAGWRSEFVLPLIVDVARRIGVKPDRLGRMSKPMLVPVEEAYRLALAFRLSRRTRSLARVEAIVEVVRGFRAEETYLWYSYLQEAKMNGKETRLAGSMALLGQAVA